jgi:hypothetical protein
MNHDAMTHEGAWGLTIGTGQHFRWLLGIAKALLVLNLLDGVFTLIWVQHFGAGELNIMMSDLVHTNALLFMLVKLTLVSLGTLMLWRNRSNPLAVVSLFFAFFSYYLVLLIHLEYSSRMFL